MMTIDTYCLQSVSFTDVYTLYVLLLQPGERGSPEQERETERERESIPFGRHLQAHHLTHLGMSYTLMSGQYDPFQGEKVKNN